MTVCDAISDALIVQASRLDPEHGADDLNSVTQMSAAAGGLIGCGVAGFLELRSEDAIDPNLFFGLYTFLISLMTISVATLSRNMEPEIVVEQRESVGDNRCTEDFDRSLKLTFATICKRMKHEEIWLCMLYFVLQGLLVPNFDDMHYVFLTENCGITSYMYDFLNILTYAGQFCFCLAFNQYLSQFEVRKLIQYSLLLMLFVTLAQFANALRLNEMIPLLGGLKILGDNQLSDVLLNSLSFFFGSQALQMISVLPTLVALTPCIPDNVEAAMTALITGVFVFSTDVGCKISGGLLCNFFGVSNASLHLYWIILLAKCPMILVTMGLTAMIPSNREIAEAAIRMDLEDQ